MENPEKWIEEWVLLFPAKIKSGGESIRTKAKYCVNKMVKFMKTHTQYNKECIFAATKLYLKERALDNWFGVRRAIYFINKLGAESLLEIYCEKIINKEPLPEKNNNLEYKQIDEFI